MTHVRQFGSIGEAPEGIGVSLGSTIAAALSAHDHTFVSYMRSEPPAESPGGFLTRFEGSSPEGELWSGFDIWSFEKEERLYYSLVETEMESEKPLPASTWGLAVGTWKQSTGAFHFYFYDLQSHELEDLGGGVTEKGPEWGGEDPESVRFGRFEGKYAAAAIFDRTLTSGEIEALAKASSVEGWASRGPKGLWIFDQKGAGEKVTDLMGHGADQGAVKQGKTSYAEVEGGLPQLALREGEEVEREVLRVNVRLVGDVSGKVYSEGAIEATSLYRDPDLYLGYCYLAAPFTPRPGDHVDRPKLDPADTQVILQAFPISADTGFAAEHWLGSLERFDVGADRDQQRLDALIELPDPLIIT